jgi:hypothetical protein
MTPRYLVSAAALAVALASASPAVLSVAAQAPKAAAPTYTPPKSTFTPPRTPWGDPDLQGIYDFQTIIRMQRPPGLAGKKTFTEAELKEYAKGNTPNEDACGTGSRAGEVCTAKEDAEVGDYNDFWDNRNFVKDYRTSLIEDPEDGRIPPMTPEAQKRQAEWQAARRSRGPLDSWTDFSTVTRCISEQTPNGPQMYNSGTLIMQSPGWVMLIRERLDTRFIPLDGRPHIDDKIRLWHGDSRGHWEGNTLVVDTTNFTDKQEMGGVGSTIPAGIPLGNLHLVEHFVPISANLIHYYATVEDPKTWTRPWTFMLPWQKDPTYTIYEYACHEGDISIENALRGERMLEQKRAEAAKTGPRPDQTGFLVGSAEAAIKAKFGEPVAIVNTRWTYETTTAYPLYLFMNNGKVEIVSPNDLPMDSVKKR